MSSLLSRLTTLVILITVSSSPKMMLPVRTASISSGRIPVLRRSSRLNFKKPTASSSTSWRKRAASSAMSGSMRGLLFLNTRVRNFALATFFAISSFSRA